MTYPVVEGITSDIVVSGKLSSLQLEGVLYAVCIFLFYYKQQIDIFLCNSNSDILPMLLTLSIFIFYSGITWPIKPHYAGMSL